MKITLSKELDPRLLLPTKNIPCFPTGFTGLDNQLGGGLHPGTLNVVMGSLGAGSRLVVETMNKCKSLLVPDEVNPSIGLTLETIKDWCLDHYKSLTLFQRCYHQPGNQLNYVKVNWFRDLEEGKSSILKRQSGIRALRNFLINNNCAAVIEAAITDDPNQLLDHSLATYADNIWKIRHLYDFKFQIIPHKNRSIKYPQTVSFELDAGNVIETLVI